MKRIVLAGFVLAVSCSHVDKDKQDQNICEEYRNLVCVTGTVCDYDKNRQCRVCRCDCIDGNCDDQNMLTNPNLPKNVEPLR